MCLIQVKLPPLGLLAGISHEDEEDEGDDGDADDDDEQRHYDDEDRIVRWGCESTGKVFSTPVAQRRIGLYVRQGVRAGHL